MKAARLPFLLPVIAVVLLLGGASAAWAQTPPGVPIGPGPGGSGGPTLAMPVTEEPTVPGLSWGAVVGLDLRLALSANPVSGPFFARLIPMDLLAASKPSAAPVRDRQALWSRRLRAR